MLSYSLNNIQSLLDTMGVRPDDSLPVEEVEILPEPGSFIPQEDHHLLNDDFEEFEPGDYVGFELHDPSLVREGGKRFEAGNRDGSYGSFFNSWAGRAREHNAQRRGYSGRPRRRRNNPQPGEARRWFKQAVADIQAASNDIIYERPSYEWACFKCHQVRVTTIMG